MNDVQGFQIADPDGTFLTLNVDEARRMRDALRADDEPLTPNLESLLLQLEEWLPDV